jgi:hypothetical protein
MVENTSEMQLASPETHFCTATSPLPSARKSCEGGCPRTTQLFVSHTESRRLAVVAKKGGGKKSIDARSHARRLSIWRRERYIYGGDKIARCAAFVEEPRNLVTNRGDLRRKNVFDTGDSLRLHNAGCTVKGCGESKKERMRRGEGVGEAKASVARDLFAKSRNEASTASPDVLLDLKGFKGIEGGERKTRSLPLPSGEGRGRPSGTNLTKWVCTATLFFIKGRVTRTHKAAPQTGAAPGNVSLSPSRRCQTD